MTRVKIRHSELGKELPNDGQNVIGNIFALGSSDE